MNQSIIITLFLVFAFSSVAENLFAQKSKLGISKRLSKKDQRLLKELRVELENLFSDEAHNNTFWGVHIESMNAKLGVLYVLNHDKNFVPASNQKLLTAGAALHYLGRSFSYKTSAHTWGSFNQSENGAVRLDGDLIFFSNGNPCHSPFWRDSTGGDFFEQLADSLIARGVTLINGNLIADDGAFHPSTPAQHWQEGDGDYPSDWAWDDLAFAMASPASALAFNENSVVAFVSPADSVGKKPLVRLEPDLPFFLIDNQATTGFAQTKRSLEVSRRLGTNVVVVSGSIPVDYPRTFRERLAVEKPAMYFLTMARDALAKKGITVSGSLRRKQATDFFLTDTLLTIAEQRSPNLLSLLCEMNKSSNNFFAEQLLHSIGSRYRDEATTEAGLSAVKHYLGKIGITDKHYYFVDACGLSRKDRIAPFALTKILKSIYNSDDFESFYPTLSIAGKDGTMHNRLRDTNAKDNCYAKTGFVGGVRTLSGYLYGKDEEWIVFSIMAMNFTQSRLSIEDVQDKAVELLADWAAERAVKP